MTPVPCASAWSLLFVLIPAIGGVILFAVLYQREASRNINLRIRNNELTGEANALRRFIGCRGQCSRPSETPKP